MTTQPLKSSRRVVAFLFAVPIAIFGGLLVGIVAAGVLKFGLGCMLIASAVRIFRDARNRV